MPRRPGRGIRSRSPGDRPRRRRVRDQAHGHQRGRSLGASNCKRGGCPSGASEGILVNITLVLIDSLNRHHLSAYVPTFVRTPNLSKFTQRAWRFDNHFVGSLPCMPARREIFAGRKEMMWRPWGPLEPYDVRLPALLRQSGYATGIVTDHYHYWEQEANGYIQAFESADLVRGHELDFWKPAVSEDEPVPRWVENIDRWRPGSGRRYFGNVKDFSREEDFFPAKVMAQSAAWLAENARNRRFFLQVESFDVHEPFHIPEPYASMYGDGSRRDVFTVWPPYQDPERLAAFMAQASPEALDFIRSQYAGKLTMVDRWFGELLRTFDRLGLWDNTMVIVTTDHGHDLGDRRAFGKQYPHFDSHANIPLLIWHPRYPGNGRSVSALTSTVDLFATVLEAAGVAMPEPTQSYSLLPVLEGTRSSHRHALLYGTFGEGICGTDGEWTIFKSPERNGPLFSYSPLLFKSLTADTLVLPVDHGLFIPGVKFPQWKVPVRNRPRSRENCLFNRTDDPAQSRNRWEDEQRQRARMLDLLHGLLAAEGTPPEQYERLGLRG